MPERPLHRHLRAHPADFIDLKDERRAIVPARRLGSRESHPVATVDVRDRPTVVHEEVSVRDHLLRSALKLDVEVKLELWRRREAGAGG